MDPRVRSHLDSFSGVLSTRAAVRLGLTANDLRAMVAAGELVRVAHGAYLDAALLVGATPEEDHRLRVTAIVLAKGGSVAASHHSAAVLHGLPVLREALGSIRVAHTRSRSNTRRRPTFTLHRCPGEDAFGSVGPVATVVPALAVIGTAVLVGVRSGLMAADAALRGELTTRDEMASWLVRWSRVPGVDRARHVVDLMSPLAESPAESLLRLALIALRLDFVEQHPLELEGWTARVDFYLPALGVVVEMDGMCKYEGSTGSLNLAAEKRREDQIRARGYGVARIEWADLFRPQRIHAKIRAAALTSRV
ncbi:type IV toxin-antitoxin system AbiEi family antitoxin domain-containing protein [Ornithinimicrobium cerasi]|uniref:type IV toxin-antitoxin system AbiEi family antitoxin domain-containing protein n=1 Tax=Ornithinimicrobium cerasi TaxID=2248773 RepID=UPI000F00372E|nr:type IV toxin-antitoxin system AbiEi family antitoxin domain-containing protein [Ornithinimicrobium cerasi]